MGRTVQRFFRFISSISLQQCSVQSPTCALQSQFLCQTAPTMNYLPECCYIYIQFIYVSLWMLHIQTEIDNMIWIMFRLYTAIWSWRIFYTCIWFIWFFWKDYTSCWPHFQWSHPYYRGFYISVFFTWL